jgi:mRNA-degrading endonuclease RelE of RelBE toxin-antitoxin system
VNVISLDVFFQYFNSLDKNVQQKVRAAIEEMEKAQSLHQLTSVSKLEDSAYFRKRIGKYRLIFEWDKTGQTIILYKIIHRKDVYKKR